MSWANAPFSLAPADKILGSALSITLPADATRVRISYATRPQASGLQWLGPPQTAGKKDPFLFTQSEAIHARSWIPLQDSPQVRITYCAHVRTPKNLQWRLKEGDWFLREIVSRGKLLYEKTDASVGAEGRSRSQGRPAKQPRKNTSA